ncbi:MAG: ABC transporter ATP-binding protein [Clostridia bacterium]|nr:ABC transporter ATP-binding protein [Clostridia bacterium]
MIEVRNLTISYGEKTVLNNISFKWKNGQSYGVYGEHGAGKTVLLDHLAGACTCKSGTVLINGFDLQAEPLKAREFIGYLPQNNALYEQMTPVEYLMYIADIKGMGYEKAIRAISGLLDVTGVSPRRDCLIGNLSPFEKKCIGIAQTALGKSDILIFDDPWKGLSPREMQKTEDLLNYLSEKATLIISGCEKEPLYELCDCIFLLSDGVLFDMSVQTMEKEEKN